jgi:excisionase family DNA binding protein
MTNLLSVKQVADLLGVKVPTLYKWCCQRTGPKFIKAGSRTLFRVEDIEQFLTEHTVKPFSDDVPDRHRRKAPARGAA